MLPVIEVIVAGGLVLLMVTQVFLPLMLGRPVFPMLKFRKERAALTDAEVAVERAALSDEIAMTRRRAIRLATPTEGERDTCQPTSSDASSDSPEPSSR